MVTTPAPVLPDSCGCIRRMRDHAEGKKPAPMPTRHIGAIVVAELLGATLITLNAREFPKVPGLHWIAP